MVISTVTTLETQSPRPLFGCDDSQFRRKVGNFDDFSSALIGPYSRFSYMTREWGDDEVYLAPPNRGCEVSTRMERHIEDPV